MSVLAADGIQAHLTGLESVWDNGMGDAYAHFRSHATPLVALAAALVVSGTALQALGSGAPEPARLLVGDLCLARASRLLAGTGDLALQVGFAEAVERAASHAAGGPASLPLGELLLAAILGAR